MVGRSLMHPTRHIVFLGIFVLQHSALALKFGSFITSNMVVSLVDSIPYLLSGHSAIVTKVTDKSYCSAQQALPSASIFYWHGKHLTAVLLVLLISSQVQTPAEIC